MVCLRETTSPRYYLKEIYGFSSINKLKSLALWENGETLPISPSQKLDTAAAHSRNHHKLKYLTSYYLTYTATML